MADFVNHEHELMFGLFYRSVRVIEQALDARRSTQPGEANLYRAVRITTLDCLPLTRLSQFAASAGRKLLKVRSGNQKVFTTKRAEVPMARALSGRL